jgi:flagellar biosynthesis/type III secretory pathway M-ring protein FliF/YscJ
MRAQDLLDKKFTDQELKLYSNMALSLVAGYASLVLWKSYMRQRGIEGPPEEKIPEGPAKQLIDWSTLYGTEGVMEGPDTPEAKEYRKKLAEAEAMQKEAEAFQKRVNEMANEDERKRIQAEIDKAKEDAKKKGYPTEPIPAAEGGANPWGSL